MKAKRPLNEQTIVLTGATSGIGLVTARKAADAGARLVLVARSEDALRTLVDEIEARGGEATYAVADVADLAAIRRVAETARECFGGFTTWINCAAISIYGRLREIDLADH